MLLHQDLRRSLLEMNELPVKPPHQGPVMLQNVDLMLNCMLHVGQEQLEDVSELVLLVFQLYTVRAYLPNIKDEPLLYISLLKFC